MGHKDGADRTATADGCGFWQCVSLSKGVLSKKLRSRAIRNPAFGRGQKQEAENFSI